MRRGRIAKAILILFFIGLIAVPVVLSRMASKGKADAAVLSEHSAMARYGFYFTNDTAKAGIHFIHQAPALDKKLAAIMPEVASLGASVSIVDYNDDGLEDIYVTTSKVGGQNALYRNNGNGTFTNVAPEMGIANVNQPGTGVSMGAVWGDYNNDGYPDLFLIKWGKPMLFRNDDGHGFTNVTKEAGLPKWMNANTALWFDYNNDGKLDLFVGGYYPASINLWHLKTTKIMPDSFEYADNGGRNYLFENLGHGKFKDVAQQEGLTGHRWTLASGAADLTGNGYPDLYIANDYGNDQLYFNNGKRFYDVSKQTGIGFSPKSGMDVSFGDVFNQGKLDIYVSNISAPGFLLQGNNLWVPKAGTSGESLQYVNMARALGVNLGGWSFGAQFADFNNEGNQDLFLTNGYISLSRTRSYWYDFANVASGNSDIIGDAKNWPAFNGRSLSGYQEKRVWVNDGDGQFENVARAVGVTDRYDGRAVAVADLFNNGAMDVVEANQNGPVILYKDHVSPEEKWIEFRLQGTRSNREAIGAELTLYWDGMKQLQEVTGGSGFAAQNGLRLHFGLGKNPHIEKAVIHWPSGTVQTVKDLTPDKLYHITEPE